MTKTAKVDPKGRIKLEEFEDFIDTSKAVSYSVEVSRNGGATVEFFDKDKKPLPLKCAGCKHSGKPIQKMGGEICEKCRRTK